VHGLYVGQIEFALLGLVMLCALASTRFAIPGIAWGRAWATISVIAFVVGIYLLFPDPRLSVWASQSHFLKEAAIYALSIAVPGVFAALFYREELFADVFWTLTRISVWIALGAYAMSKAGFVVLVNDQAGHIRLQGLLGEPSAWASVVAAGLLIALRRKSWLYLALLVLVAGLAQSPTVFIVVAITIPLHYLLTGPFRPRRFTFLLAMAIIVPFLINFVQTTNPAQLLGSGNQLEVSIGRMVSGVQNVESGGATGQNDRFASTQQTIAEADADGRFYFGAGPGASNVIFPAKFQATADAGTLRPNALWVDVLYDFGRVGVVVLVALLVTAVMRMRRVPRTAEILLPFIIASFINSAEGMGLWQFATLAVFLFAFGWGIPKRTHS
jgi:hypothetical protein